MSWNSALFDEHGANLDKVHVVHPHTAALHLQCQRIDAELVRPGLKDKTMIQRHKDSVAIYSCSNQPCSRSHQLCAEGRGGRLGVLDKLEIQRKQLNITALGQALLEQAGCSVIVAAEA